MGTRGRKAARRSRQEEIRRLSPALVVQPADCRPPLPRAHLARARTRPGAARGARPAAARCSGEAEVEEEEDSLAELEKQRLRNIERNQEMLRALGLL